MEKLDVVNAALGALKAGRTCELVVVAGTAGSSLRGVGAWMAVFADGSQAGTIGGGKIELFALDEARELLAAGQSRLVRYTMGGENSDTGMICGGAICLCYLHLDASQAPLFQSVADVLAYRRIGDFVIDFEPFIASALESDAAEYHGEESRRTIVGCPGLSLTEEGSKVTYTNAASEIPPAHIETLCPEGLTYIFGCGHVGAATARVLTAAGFAVVACDDRPGTLTPEWVPGVYDRRLVDYKNLDESCPIGPRDLVVVATAGHKSDIDVVIQALRAKPAYLGCLGSRRKTAFVRARLEQEGFTHDGDFVRDHLDLVHLVADIDQCHAQSLQLAHDAEQRFHFVCGQRGSGLVQDQHLAVCGNSLCNFHHLHLCDAQRAKLCMGIDLQLQLFQQLLRILVHFGVIHHRNRTVLFGGVAAQPDVLGHGACRDRLQFLMHHGNAAVQCIQRGGDGNFFALV